MDQLDSKVGMVLQCKIDPSGSIFLDIITVLNTFNTTLGTLALHSVPGCWARMLGVVPGRHS